MEHALVGSTGVIGVGGDGASLIDFDHAVYGDFPLMLALIAIATFILLTRAFRSVLLALKAVVFNLISLAAAYGVMTWVFQDGHLSKAVFGVPATGAITMWVPLMVFAFLFGLSMDYEVFILTRIREAYDSSRDARSAVVTGLGRTGRLVTSAAAILMLGFVSMSTSGQTDLKILATGLGAGHPGGRRGGALPARPGDGGPVRPGELVAARLAGPCPADRRAGGHGADGADGADGGRRCRRRRSRHPPRALSPWFRCGDCNGS